MLAVRVSKIEQKVIERKIFARICKLISKEYSVLSAWDEKKKF